jgi:glyoxylate/hydroxypyruvate/2-ketogluconate reductase
MKPKVYVALKIEEEIKEYLNQHCEIKTWDEEESVPRSVLLREIADCEGVMLVAHKVDEELLNQAPKLKVVSNVSVGYNNFDIPEMKKRRVLGMNTPGVVNDSTADIVFALILSAARKVPQLNQYIKEGLWIEDFSEEFYGLDVHHSIIGIIGMGRIGEVIAKRARFGFDMKVLYHNRTRNIRVEDEIGAEYCSMEKLLMDSDFVVLMTPLTEETRGFMGEAQFKQMKKSAIFINASRGGTVDQKALVKALQEEWIWSAGLDVFEKEPIDSKDPLLKLKNLVAVPHIGTATRKTSFEMGMLAAQNLVAAFQGKELKNLVKELGD